MSKRNNQESRKMPKQSPEHRIEELILEGSHIPLFTSESAYFEECRRSGLAGFILPFTEYWPTFSRGLKAKALEGGRRLLCYSCVVEMPTSFNFNLPGGLGSIVSGTVAVGSNLPGNLPAAVKAAMCPYCGSDTGILLLDHPDYGEITIQDMQALLELWRYRSQVWWSQSNRPDGICDRCSKNRIPRGEGYHRGYDVICEACAQGATGMETLPDLKKIPITSVFPSCAAPAILNLPAGTLKRGK